MLAFSVRPDVRKVDMDFAISDKFKPKTDLGREWLGETYLNAVEETRKGNSFDENMQIDKYAHKCEINVRANKNKKETNLLTDDEIEMGFRGVSDNILDDPSQDIVDIVIAKLDKEEAEERARELADKFYEMHSYLLINKGVDLRIVVKNALSVSALPAYSDEDKLRKQRYVKKLADLMQDHNLDGLIQEVLREEVKVYSDEYYKVYYNL